MNTQRVPTSSPARILSAVTNVTIFSKFKFSTMDGSAKERMREVRFHGLESVLYQGTRTHELMSCLMCCAVLSCKFLLSLANGAVMLTMLCVFALTSNDSRLNTSRYSCQFIN